MYVCVLKLYHIYIVDENSKGITSQSDLRFSNMDIFNIKSTTNNE